MFARPSTTFLRSQYCGSTGLWTGLQLLNHPSAVMSTNFNILGRKKSDWSMAAGFGWVHNRERQHVFYNKPVGKFFHSQCPNSLLSLWRDLIMCITDHRKTHGYMHHPYDVWYSECLVVSLKLTVLPQ